MSAVIPVFNRKGTIGRAIESVLAQEFPAAEVLVVDDGSQDGTGTIVAAYGTRVRCVWQANAGVSSARNRGVREARSDWIAFLDSDDYWQPGHLSRMAAAIDATQGEAALYFSDLRRSPEEGGERHWQKCRFQPRAPFEFRRDGQDWVAMRTQPMMFQASVIRRDKYLESGALPDDLRTREDTLMFFKLGLLYPVCAVSGCGTIMMHDGGGRLTQEIDSTSVEYCRATISLFRHLLALGQSLGERQERWFMDQLSFAYYGMAQASYRQKMYGSLLKHLLYSGFTRPKLCAGCLVKTLRRLVLELKPGGGRPRRVGV